MTGFLAASHRLAEKLAAFEHDQDTTFLHEALDLIEAAQREVAPGATTARSQVLSLWMRMLSFLDRNTDPTWDLENLPVKGATPPPVEGRLYPSGEVDPSTIPDPADRAAYEQALEASKGYAKFYDTQFELRRIDERASLLVERLLADRYTGSEEDRLELEEQMAACALSELRRDRLRVLMPTCS